MSWYAKAWATLGAGAVAGFAIVETTAILNEDWDGTLTHQIRTLAGFADEGPAPVVRRAVFFIAVAWFVSHISRQKAASV